jgi:hypothetical protein
LIVIVNIEEEYWSIGGGLWREIFLSICNNQTDAPIRKYPPPPPPPFYCVSFMFIVVVVLFNIVFQMYGTRCVVLKLCYRNILAWIVSRFRWGKLDKINVHIIYNLIFFNGHKLHVYGSWNITKQKKLKIIMQWPFIKSPPIWYGSGLPPIYICICIYCSKMIKTHIFWMKFHPKTLKNLNFEIYMQFFQILWHALFCHKYTPYIQVFHFFLNFKK